VLNAVASWSVEIDPLFAVSAASYHLSNALFISARVTELSLSASKAVHNAAWFSLPPRPPPAPGCGAAP